MDKIFDMPVKLSSGSKKDSEKEFKMNTTKQSFY